VARYRRGRVFGASRTDGGVEELPQEAGLALPKVLALQPSDLRRKGGTLRRVSSLPSVPLQKRRYARGCQPHSNRVQRRRATTYLGRAGSTGGGIGLSSPASQTSPQCGLFQGSRSSPAPGADLGWAALERL